MSTPAAFVKACERTVGTKESPAGTNRQPFAAEAGHANGYPWCATWVVAMAKRAGIKGVPNTAYTPTMAAGFKAADRAITPSNARPGDVLLMDFPGALARIEHVGVIVDTKDNGRTLLTIEGNTSNYGSQSNGGAVLRKTRTLSGLRGYTIGRPTFDKAAGPLTVDADDVYLQRGDRGADVITWQKQLNKARDAGLDTDGVFGKATDAATRAFQRSVSLGGFGKVGPTTLGRMRAELRAIRDADADPSPVVPALVVYGKHAADERIGNALAGALDLGSASPLDDRRRTEVTYLIGRTAVRGYDRELAGRVVEVAGASKLTTFDEAAALMRAAIAKH